jgi:hypothetical protein
MALVLHRIAAITTLSRLRRKNYNPLPAVRDIYAKPRSPNCTEYEYGDLENVH